MKKVALTITVAVLAISMVGCFVEPVDNPSATSSHRETSNVLTQEEIERIERVESQLAAEVMTPLEDGTLSMPRIDIVTKSTDENALDFVINPVTRHVANSIASYTPDYIIPVEPYYVDCAITVTDTTNTVTVDAADAEVKVRGSWTTSYDKKPLRIKFSEKQGMLGLNDGAEFKNWVLLAEYKDSSMLRNKTIFQIANEILEPEGYYCTDAKLVEVTINGKYWGVYLLAEQQEAKENRVNVPEPEEDYTGTDIGYFLEFDGYYFDEDELQRFHVDYVNNAPLNVYTEKGVTGKTVTVLPTGREYDKTRDVGFTIKSDIYSKQQRDFIANFVNGVYKIMYEASYKKRAYVFNDDCTELTLTAEITPKEAIEKVIDVNSLVNIYIINEVACDADIYWSSFFMTADFTAEGDRKLVFTAPWDFDSAMGNVAAAGGRCMDAQGLFTSIPIVSTNNKYESLNPWLAVIADEDWFQELVKERWTEIYDSGVFDRAIEMIKNDSKRYIDNIKRNYLKWENLGRTPKFTIDLSQEVPAIPTYNAAVNFLKSWLEARVEFLNSQWHK